VYDTGDIVNGWCCQGDGVSHVVIRSVYVIQVTSSMAGVVKAMESAMKSMNLEKVVIVKSSSSSSSLSS